jgi:cation diffusion facilitator family transporter
LNGGLGAYLIRQGKRYHSLVLEADGKHILTDCMTSFGVIIALICCRLTGWIYFDPILAILIALNILWTGIKLISHACHGLMDRSDLALDDRIRRLLNQAAEKYKVNYHNLRHRNAGNRLMIEVHLLFPKDFSIFKAHELATHIENEVANGFEKPTELVTHLEPYEGHDEIHARLLGHEG